MKTSVNILSLAIVSLVVASFIMMPKVSADLAQKQLSKTIFHQSIQIVTLEARVKKSNEMYQELVYIDEKRERLMTDTVEKLQVSIDDKAAVDIELDNLKSVTRELKTKIRGLEKKLKLLKTKKVETALDG